MLPIATRSRTLRNRHLNMYSDDDEDIENQENIETHYTPRPKHVAQKVNSLALRLYLYLACILVVISICAYLISIYLHCKFSRSLNPFSSLFSACLSVVLPPDPAAERRVCYETEAGITDRRQFKLYTYTVNTKWHIVSRSVTQFLSIGNLWQNHQSRPCSTKEHSR